MSSRYRELPFIKANASGAIESYWHVKPTQSWAVDNKTGQEYALKLIAFMRSKQEPTLFASVVKDIPKHGLAHAGGLNGISVGFLHEFARRAIG